jgi:hypothetical protein
MEPLNVVRGLFRGNSWHHGVSITNKVISPVVVLCLSAEIEAVDGLHVSHYLHGRSRHFGGRFVGEVVCRVRLDYADR